MGFFGNIFNVIKFVYFAIRGYFWPNSNNAIDYDSLYVMLNAIVDGLLQLNFSLNELCSNLSETFYILSCT